jgi:multiple sugar transport system substrate-binding protein
MNRVLDRRRFLTVSGKAGAAAAMLGVEGIVAARRAPAFAQGARLQFLQWSHFIPAADVLFEAQAKEFGKQAGVEVALERINQNDIQARVTAAIQSGAGPDIIVIGNNHPQLYENSLVDMSDVAEEIGSKQGGWWDYAKVNCFAGGRWVGLPHFIISWAVNYREDWLQQEGLSYPKTWDEFRTAGRKMKSKGKPFGQAFGHSINDPNAWAYPLVWMWGGMEIDKDGRTVALDRKATVEAVKFNNVLWKECFDEGGLAWDDSNNNRAFLSQEISLTGNAPSIYVAARQKFPDVYKGMNHGHYPGGPAGRFYFLPLWSSCVMKYSRQPKLAKDFIRFYMDRAQYDRYFEVMDTFGIPGTRAYRDHPLWKKDPKTAVFPETLQYARPVGYAGPPDRRATEALSKYILVDMFAKSIQGMRPEDAVAWAAGELKKIYVA